MNRFITSVVAVALSALVTVQAQAQIKRDKKPPGDLTAPVKSRTAAESVPNNYQALGGLVIERLEVYRSPYNPEEWGLVAEIYNPSTLARKDLTYSVSTSIYINGSWWDEVKVKASIGFEKSLQAKGSRFVMATWREAGGVARRVKLEIGGPSVQASRVLILTKGYPPVRD